MKQKWPFSFAEDLWDIRPIASGTIMADFMDNGIRCLVMRGPCNYCAYLGIANGHPLAGHEYDNIPLSVHGGLTFGGKGDGYWPEGYFWYGWDYGHCDDWATYYEKSGIRHDGKKWTLGEVVSEVKEATWDFKKIMELAEAIYKKTMWEPNTDNPSDRHSATTGPIAPNEIK